MIGFTFYHAPVVAEQGAEAALFYDDDVFPTLELDVLQTLDFEMMLADCGSPLSVGEPIYFDEEEGAVIFKVNPATLEFVSNLPPDDDEATPADFERFKVFVAQHGVAPIYESGLFNFYVFCLGLDRPIYRRRVTKRRRSAHSPLYV